MSHNIKPKYKYNNINKKYNKRNEKMAAWRKYQPKTKISIISNKGRSIHPITRLRPRLWSSWMPSGWKLLLCIITKKTWFLVPKRWHHFTKGTGTCPLCHPFLPRQKLQKIGDLSNRWSLCHVEFKLDLEDLEPVQLPKQGCYKGIPRHSQ